ncbi:MAG: hydroxymethylglutaryl-CoA synthase [Ignavibacteria bacterium GWB2_35_12]|nr:MAG: hydroxymethylglutaryl-CoA synthase [Ignavibacteria bacterium GWA2_35_8]OGU39290.1 MAG: hydroxymethylglutaryl-CoA synthase [Ignavibacteria bacterium GWB2_35_12]OGU95931.1 MAG: hydroxymethylglutaryl-CoA synthase [Ignavibacteria bacterium RIFOXYA2_FULL_35_10]OGV21172.1 MAG: hydroxymethylglutaryl-CoA synthase [Ignavibacteria bacterium RIFOXYC2_FULL_35_21]
MMVGIVGYGAYVPAFRIKASTIADQWGDDIVAIERGLLMKEKTVPGKDEDTITISVAAAKNAVKRAGIDPQKIGAVYIGSESHPYAVKPSGTVLIDALGIGPDVHVADFEFACKAGSEAMFVAYSHVKSGNMDYAMGIGSDTSQGAPGDALEYSASAGGAAFIFGKDNVIAEVLHTHSFTTDTADFWRREYQHYPRHGGRFTGEPAYFKHLLGCGKLLLEKSKMKASDFAYAVFHMPNGKFPLKGGEILGFKKEQMEQGWLVNIMGNTYSGSSPTGLTAILDVAKPGDKIFMVSFGSGAGSDGFIFKATPRITQVQNKAPKTRDMLNGKKIYLDYGKYAAFRRKIKFLE